jgi:hypothetical protein
MLSPRKLCAVELLAAGRTTYTQVAEQSKITQVTLRRWRKDPIFAQAVLDRSRELMKDSLPSIYNVLTDNALTGSHQHIRLLLEHLQKVDELAKTAEQGTISFTWRSNEAKEPTEAQKGQEPHLGY